LSYNELEKPSPSHLHSSVAYTISEKATRFPHSDRAQKSISSSMSRHQLIRNMSSKSMYAFLS